MVRRGRRGPRVEVSTEKYRHLVNPFEPLKILSEDQVAHIHNTAVRYLADKGMGVLLPDARSILVDSGATVDDEGVVRFDPDVVEAALRSAPSEFEFHAPNPARNVAVGGRNIALVPVAGPPFVSDRLNGRRYGTLADQENFVRLIQSFDVMAVTTPAIEPSDIPVNIRHLRSNFSALLLSDKVPFIFARGSRRVRDGFDQIKVRLGIDTDEEFALAPRTWTNVNTNSPRQLDIPMAMGIIDFARAGQACIITPFTLAGAMAPVTLAGALVLQHMESIAGITLSQLVRPGAPVIYGSFTSNVDMKSGSPAFGTPEAVKGAIASGQLARHIDIPWRSSGSSTSNTVDAQGGYETMMNMFGAIQGGANWIMHSAGWQEGGLTASFEKFILDIEMCQMFAETFSPLEVNDDELATDAISAAGPGGHFFGLDHTLERYETAFYDPIVFSRANFEQWTEDGSQDAAERATKIWQQTLADFEAPPVDASVIEEMTSFVDRRIAEGGAAPD